MAVTKVLNSESKQFKPVLVDKLVLDTVPTVGSLNGVTSDAVAKAISDAGNVPTPSAGDAGKVLGVLNSSGDIGWVEDQSGTLTQVQANWNETDNTQVSFIQNKPDLSVYAESSDLATVATTGDYSDLSNKPDLSVYVESSDLATVATSGSYNDLSDKPTIPAAQVNADWNAVSGVSQILNKPNLATVATSGSYSDLSNKPSIPAAQVNADWNAESGIAAILNKPDMSDYAEKANLATVATSGSYEDLSNKPTIPAVQVQSNWAETDSTSKSYIQNKPDMTAYAQTANLATVATTGDYDDLSNKPSLAAVATSGSYTDLSNKPSIPAAQVNSDWDAVSGVAQILNKPNLATVATTGDYNDLTNKPSIPAAVTVDQHYNSQSANAQSGVAVAEAIAGTGQVPTVTSADDNKVLMASYSGGVGSFSWEPSAAATQVNADWDATSGVAKILNKPDLSVYAQSANLATVATSGNYNDLSNRPSIPAAQVNSDWDAASGVAQILNKPNLAAVATSGDYADLSNKPTIPAAQVQANWNETDSAAKSYIQNKPDLTAYAQTSSLATVATTGDYDDLTNKPTIPAAQVQSNWNETSTSSKSYIQNKPDLSVYAQSANLATVATSGSYNDLSDKPTIPAAVTVDQTYSASSTNAQSGVAVASAISGKQDTINDLATIRSGAAAGATAVQPSSLATVATTGSYSDLSNTPTIPVVDQTYSASSTNAQSGAAVAGALATVNQVPASTSSDSTKVLTVNSSGTPVWAAAQGGTVDQVYNASSTNAQSGTAVAGALAAVPTKPLVAGSNITITENTNDITLAATMPNVDEVPAVTSSDDGKVLTATYSGGVGSYAWAAASGGTTYTAGNMVSIDANNNNAIGVSTTAGITDIQQVAALPANPVSTVLYLIPET